MTSTPVEPPRGPARKRRALVAALTAIAVCASLGIGWAASLTLTSAHLGASAVTTPAMFPVSVTLANKGGGHVGKLENGDIMTLVWSQPIDETTLCSGWSNSASTHTVTLQWSVVNGGASDDYVQVTGTTATCVGGLHAGTIDLGATGYNISTTASIDFVTTSNAVNVGASTTTLTVTLNGQKNGTAGTVTSGAAATWTPDAALTDRTGRSCGANLAMTTSTVQF